MEKMIKTWLKLGIVVFPFGCLFGIKIWTLPIQESIKIGWLFFVIWFVTLNVFSKINRTGWVWKW